MSRIINKVHLSPKISSADPMGQLERNIGKLFFTCILKVILYLYLQFKSKNTKNSIMKLEEILFYLAAILCFLGGLAHELIGAPMVLSPLAETNLPEEVIWLHHFSWHVGSISLIGMILLYVYAARNKGNYPVAFIASITLAGFAILGISLALFGNPVLWSSPAPYVWVIVSMIGFWGVSLERSKYQKSSNPLIK